MKSTDRKVVITSFKKAQRLKKSTRNLLSRIIIKNEKDRHFQNVDPDGDCHQLNGFKIKRERFVELSQHICQIFKNPFTYYTPYRKVNKRCINPSGCLYEHYEYSKRTLKAKGLLKRTHQPLLPALHYKPSEVEKENLDWLENHITPEQTAIYVWKLTFNARSTSLVSRMIRFDFETLYPKKEQNFQDRWNVVEAYLEEQLRECEKIKNLTAKALVLLLPSLLQNNTTAFILYLLPYLIDGTRISKKKSENNPSQSTSSKAVSFQERRDCFVIHVEVATGLDLAIDQHKTKLQAAQLPFQPVVVLVGPCAAIESVYVCINS
ncbi:Protein of unknown function [Cotesia congregata]|uniref:Uncharacterized protein n=1 Tax=Cotesia congregata TaxID=51543 RepID=A0A8J2HB79_COTCN|nr:Protein of unknown function [Cotesia congregata]